MLLDTSDSPVLIMEFVQSGNDVLIFEVFEKYEDFNAHMLMIGSTSSNLTPDPSVGVNLDLKAQKDLFDSNTEYKSSIQVAKFNVPRLAGFYSFAPVTLPHPSADASVPANVLAKNKK